jgi:hypothetical protein
MKNLFFSALAVLFSLSVSAQTEIAFSELRLNEGSSFVENYRSTASPNTLLKTQGEPWGKGMFIDFVASLGTKNTVSPGFPALAGRPAVAARTLTTELVSASSIRFGTKWYFSDKKKFRPGIQAVWARIGVVVPLAVAVVVNGSNLSVPTTVTFEPFNVGSTNLLTFNENTALELNFNIGFHSSFIFTPLVLSTGSQGNQTLMQFGVLLNPAVKFRYKKFSVGIDFSFMHGGVGQIFESAQPARLYAYETNFMLIGITIGGKF